MSLCSFFIQQNTDKHVKIVIHCTRTYRRFWPHAVSSWSHTSSPLISIQNLFHVFKSVSFPLSLRKYPRLVSRGGRDTVYHVGRIQSVCVHFFYMLHINMLLIPLLSIQHAAVPLRSRIVTMFARCGFPSTLRERLKVKYTPINAILKLPTLFEPC